MRESASAPESVCAAGGKGAKQTSTPQKTQNQVHSLGGCSRRPGWGRGPRRRSGAERSGRGRLCRAAAAHASRARTRPPAPQPRARRAPPSLHPGGEGAAFRWRPEPSRVERGSGVGIGSEPVELQKAESGAGRGTGRRERREQALAAARSRPPSPSWATCKGHPRGGRPAAAKRRFSGAALGLGPLRGRPRRTPPLFAPARPNYLSPSSLRSPPPQPPPPPLSRRVAGPRPPGV